jgi:serine/threonine protein kinase
LEIQINDIIIITDIYHFQFQTGEEQFTEKYQIGQVLGMGSTSSCHRCIERSTGREYACKIIDKAYVESLWDGMMDQFYTEIDVLKSLHHPNIIHLYDVYYTAQKIYIVMELMEGGTFTQAYK